MGLAPGRTGANRTGRPFTGDFAGVLLYQTLVATGFATGRYDARPDDGLNLVDCMITNAVRCAPPGNKPLPAEEAACRAFLVQRLAALPRLRVIVTLGDVARRNVMRALGLPASAGAPGHGSETLVSGYQLINSYHCSRLNTNTGRLDSGHVRNRSSTVLGRSSPRRNQAWAWLVGPGMEGEDKRGAQYDLDVEPDGPAFDIFQILGHPRGHVADIVSATAKS